MNKLRLVALSAALSGVSLLAPIAPAQEVPDGWPDWLKQAMSAESRGLKRQEVALGEGAFSSRLRGKALGEISAIDDGWYVTSDIGAAVPLECWIFQTSVDPATMASNIADVSISAAEQNNGPLQSKSLYYVDMGVVEDTPYLALEWFYSVGEAPNTVVGLSKVRVGIMGDTTVACGHNTVGHRETFANAFEVFVGEAVVAGAAAVPDYEEVYVNRIGDQPVALSHATFSLDDEGDTAIRRVESTLLPVDNATLNVSDSWTVAFARPDGTLINQVSVTTENGQLTTNLNLQRDDESVWQVSGTFQGKQVAAALGADVRPMADSGQMRAVAALMASDEQRTTTMQAWVPEADPSQFMEVTATLGDSDDGSGVLQLGPIRVDALFEATGSIRDASMDIGGTEMRIERVWQRGSLP